MGGPSKFQRAWCALCLAKPTAAVVFHPAQDACTSRALAAHGHGLVPWQAQPAALHEAISAILSTALPSCKTDSAAALGVRVAQHAAAGRAEAARTVWLSWEALATATDKAGGALLRASCAICRAGAVAALIAIAAKDSFACWAGTAEAGVLRASQALATTGHQPGAALPTLGRAAGAIRGADSGAALRVRCTHDAGIPSFVEATLAVGATVHALASAVNHACAALFGATLAVWQADAIAALRRGLAKDATACGAQAALISGVANDAFPAARERAWAALFRAADPRSHTHSVTALVRGTAKDPRSVRSKAAGASFCRRQALPGTGDRTWHALLRTALTLPKASTIAALSTRPTDNPLA